MNSRAKVAPIVGRQDGVIGVEQARTLGVSLDVIRGFRERGEWVPMLPGVFRIAETRPTAVMRIRAAALWAGQPSCAPSTLLAAIAIQDHCVGANGGTIDPVLHRKGAHFTRGC